MMWGIANLLAWHLEKTRMKQKNNLMKENPWIKEHSFDEKMFIVKELAPCINADKHLSFLVELLDDKQLNEYTTWLKSIK